jgi:hypothetical protein
MCHAVVPGRTCTPGRRPVTNGLVRALRLRPCRFFRLVMLPVMYSGRHALPSRVVRGWRAFTHLAILTRTAIAAVVVLAAVAGSLAVLAVRPGPRAGLTASASAGVPGLEPRSPGPEPGGLPIAPYPIMRGFFTHPRAQPDPPRRRGRTRIRRTALSSVRGRGGSRTLTHRLLRPAALPVGSTRPCRKRR